MTQQCGTDVPRRRRTRNGGAWVSPDVHPPAGVPVAGVIFRPRTSSADPFVPETYTPCVD